MFKMKVLFLVGLAVIFLGIDLLMVLYGLLILDLGYVLIFGWMFIAGSLTLYTQREKIVSLIEY